MCSLQSDSEYKDLLAFLYQSPVSLVQVAPNGDITMMTPCAGGLLLPLSNGALDNLYQVLDPVAPQLRRLIAGFTDGSGVVCDGLQISVAGGMNNPAKSLSISVFKIDAARFMVMINDITGDILRKERERRDTAAAKEAQQLAEQANQAKSRFISTMSHELRTPLNAILGFTETIQEGLLGPVTPGQDKALATIEASGRHLLSLINDLLDLAKIEADKMEVCMEQVSVTDICVGSFSLVAQQALHKGVQLCRPVVDESLTMLTDPRRLKQILTNLLTNGVKFTPEAGRVGMDVGDDRNSGAIRFVVWDTGIGISAADRERLFNPFEQADNDQSRNQEGTGLGLSLAKQLTELLGGTLAMESEPGRGTRFTITLPRQAAEVADWVV